MNTFCQFREKKPDDDAWITGVADKLWGGVEIISLDHTYNILSLPNIIAEQNGKPAGFIMYAKKGNEWEIVALYCEVEHQGIATALIKRVFDAAKIEGTRRVWLMTTNDNTGALRFYQKQGFVITAIRVNAIEAQRKVKPIPVLGNDGIPIRDEIELEVRL